jgi:hypothetical protein
MTIVSVTIQSVIAHAIETGSDFFSPAYLEAHKIRVLIPSEAVYDTRTSTYYFVTADAMAPKKEKYTIRKMTKEGNFKTVTQVGKYNTYADALHKIHTCLAARRNTSAYHALSR